ncbi:hypothetical protein APA_4317 [Pseudanabaena sp. lw0831]|nr:hypothetical protein APA_4317 [Pseudanabaena sp. lw0831]
MWRLKVFTRSPLITHKPDLLFPQINQRSPLITNTPDPLFSNIKQRSPTAKPLGDRSLRRSRLT